MGNSAASSSSSTIQRETATTPGLSSSSSSSSYDNVTILKQKLIDAEELHKKMCEDLLLSEKRLKSVQERNKKRIKDTENELNDAKNIDTNEVHALYNNRIAEMNERKDKELASEIEVLQTIIFPERLEAIKQEVLEKVQSLRDKHWEQRLIELKEMEKKDIEIIKKIARSEHENALKKVAKRFKEEVSHVEDKILEKRKRSSIFSSTLKFIKSLKPKKLIKSNKHDDDNNDSDDSDDSDDSNDSRDSDDDDNDDDDVNIKNKNDTTITNVTNSTITVAEKVQSKLQIAMSEIDNLCKVMLLIHYQYSL